jgi:hypothetical protein
MQSALKVMRAPAVQAINVLRSARHAGLPAAKRRHYTGAVLDRETERAEFASGLLAKVGGKRLPGAGFEVGFLLVSLRKFCHVRCVALRDQRAGPLRECILTFVAERVDRCMAAQMPT